MSQFQGPSCTPMGKCAQQRKMLAKRRVQGKCLRVKLGSESLTKIEKCQFVILILILVIILLQKIKKSNFPIDIFKKILYNTSKFKRKETTHNAQAVE